MAGAPMHGFDLAHLVPAIAWKVNDERGIGGLRKVRIVFSAADQDGKLRPIGVGDEPLVAIDHPFFTILIGHGLNQRRVRSGYFWLGHGKT